MNDEAREEILLTQGMVRIESSNPGAYEGAMSDFVYNWFKANTTSRSSAL